MKLIKLTKIGKRVLAITLAIAMTLVGNYFMPKSIGAAQAGYTDAIIDNDFHTIGTDGWQYKFRGNHLVEYKGGTAYDDPLITNITRSENNDHDFQIKTPVATVTPGHTYKMTMRIDNYGTTTQGAKCYATITDPTAAQGDITSNYNNMVDVPAGSYREIELEFTAPASGQIYSKVNWGWSALCEFKFTPTLEDITPAGWTDCVVDNNYHTIGNDGFQYKFRDATSAKYKDGTGTSLDEPLDIQVTNSINNDHDFQTKSPVATVTPGNTYRLTYNLANLGTTSAQDCGNNIYATVTDASNDNDITSNFNSKVGLAHNDDVDIVLEFVAPASGQVYFKLNNSWTPKTEFILTPVIEDITPSDWTNCIVDNDFHTIGQAGFQYKFREATTARYQGGEAIDDPLDIQITNGINNDHDFITNSPVVSVTPGNTYRLTYNVANLGTTAAHDLGNNTYSAVTNPATGEDIATSFNDKVGVPHDDDVDIVLEFDAPASGQVYFKLNSSYTPATELVLTPAVEDITEPGWTNCTIDNEFHTIGNAGFQYQFRETTIAKYKGGETINDPLHIKLVNTIDNDHDFITNSPVATVTPGHKYKLTYNVANEGTNDTGDTFYSAVMNASGDAELATNYNSKIGIDAGTSENIELTFQAPESGQVYFKLNSSYTPVSEYVLTPALTDLTPDAQACTQGAWTFAGNNNTGWQYYVPAAGSAYTGGTSINDDLTINYGTYADADPALMARTPIYQVEPGKTYTGTLTIENGAAETMKQTTCAVNAYNSSTGAYDWIPATITGGTATVPAGGTTTFNISYTAPDYGYVVFVTTSSWTSGMSQYKFSATNTPPADGKYDVAVYKSGDTPTYPTKEGKLFAGWYDDDEFTTVHTGNTGLAYAKFIDEDVLAIKFQVANNGSAVRFVSSLDSMGYEQVGFKFTGTYGNAVITEKTKYTETLYTKITADGESILPTVFSGESQYFFTYTVRGMTDAGTNSTWKVTPFYVTLDGTTVTGKTGNYPQA